MVEIYDILTRFVSDEVKVMFNKSVAFVSGAVFAFGLAQDACCMKNEGNSNESERKVTFANPIETNDSKDSNRTVPNRHRRRGSFTDSTDLNRYRHIPRSYATHIQLQFEDLDNKAVDIEQIPTSKEQLAPKKIEDYNWLDQSAWMNKKNNKNWSEEEEVSE